MNRHFGGTYRHHLHGKKNPRAKNQREQVAAVFARGYFYPEYGGNTFFQNVG
jgi:hypothetical protein